MSVIKPVALAEPLLQLYSILYPGPSLTYRHLTTPQDCLRPSLNQTVNTQQQSLPAAVASLSSVAQLLQILVIVTFGNQIKFLFRI